jgi:ABC-type nitrate/sulfonate/bicarbonate transport system substrate-binding protein
MCNPKAHSGFAVFMLVFLALIVCLGSGCSQRKKQPGPPEKITVAYATSFEAVLVHVAFAQGYFAEEGLDATPQAHVFGKLALDSVVEGKADVATAGDTPVMFAVMAGKKIAILASIETSNKSTAIVTRRDRGINTPSDLKGKRVGVTLGTTGDFFLHVFLTAHDINGRQVRIIELEPDEMAAAMNGGTIDAAATWNPVVTQLQNDLGSSGRIFYGEALYTETFCAVARRDFVRERPEAVKKFLRALVKAETFVGKHPKEARRLAAEFAKTDKSILDRIWGGYNFRVTLDQALVVDLEDQTGWAMKHRLTSGSVVPNWMDFIYADGLQAVKPKTITIIR